MVVFASLLILGAGCASKQAASEEHHPEVQAQQKAGEGAGMMGQGGMMGPGGMMDKMDMSQMTGMMHDCMAMHKDGKMCEQQCMEKCQANMEKGDCQKMMKDVKKDEKKAKGKK